MENRIFLPRDLRLSNFGIDNRWFRRYEHSYFSLVVGCKVMATHKYDLHTNNP